MKIVIQRVSKASVTINKNKVAEINNGLLILVGIVVEDAQEDIDFLVRKIANLRIFNDENGVMNHSLLETKGEVIVVPQFTLQASTKKGNRPSYIKAAKPEIAIPIYENSLQTLEKELHKKVQTGEFGADMKIQSIDDGPVSLWLDSKAKDY